MGAYSLEQLVRKWGRDELTVEQAVGQVLLHLQDLQDAVVNLERLVYRWPPVPEDDSEDSRS